MRLGGYRVPLVGAVLLAIGLGAGFLHVFYRAVQFQWPTSYFTVETRLGYAITATPWRYIAFRFAPVFLTCVFAAVTLDRVHESPALGVAGIALIHAATTSGLAIVSLVRGHEARDRPPLVALHFFVAVGIGLAAAAALVSRDALASLVPPVRELSASLWTALLAAVIGGYILYLSRTRTMDQNSAFARSRSTIPDKLWNYATVVAQRSSVDTNLVHAIMLVENIQRPRWWRRLEQLKGKFMPVGTYGIMQVHADAPISDEESIERAVGELAGVQLSYDEQWPDYDELRAVALDYNPDENFANGIVSACFYVVQPPVP